jgi:hypothetical protein
VNALTKRLQVTVVAALCVSTLGLATTVPANADGGASTRNIILGIGALAGAAAVGSNLAHKKAQSNQAGGPLDQARDPIGYTTDGAKVYSNGNVIMPDGKGYYPKDYGQTVACNNGVCTITGGSNDAPYISNPNNPPNVNNAPSTNNAPSSSSSGPGATYDS